MSAGAAVSWTEGEGTGGDRPRADRNRLSECHDRLDHSGERARPPSYSGLRILHKYRYQSDKQKKAMQTMLE